MIRYYGMVHSRSRVSNDSERGYSKAVQRAQMNKE